MTLHTQIRGGRTWSCARTRLLGHHMTLFTCYSFLVSYIAYFVYVFRLPYIVKQRVFWRRWLTSVRENRTKDSSNALVIFLLVKVLSVDEQTSRDGVGPHALFSANRQVCRSLLPREIQRKILCWFNTSTTLFPIFLLLDKALGTGDE